MNTNYFYGIVEDRDDPLKIGRVRVRVHQIHTDDKQLIATPDLPWSQVILPTTSASLSGFGTQHGLIEGSTVIGFFRDNEMQDFVVMGSAAGIPQKGGRITAPKGEQLGRSSSRGFNDPRKFELSDYEGTPDGPNPQHEPRRGWGITSTLKDAPREPVFNRVLYNGGRNIFTPQTFDKKDDVLKKELTNPQTKELRGLYPLYFDKSDIDERARGEHNDGKGGGYDDRNKELAKRVFRDADFWASGVVEIGNSEADPMYPYNKTIKTESGHFLELDDTRGEERIAVEHRTGTFLEIDKRGNQITRVVGDNYQVVCNGNNVHIGGYCRVKIMGGAKIEVGKDFEVTGLGKGKIHAKDELEISSGKEMTLRSAGDIRFDAKRVRR